MSKKDDKITKRQVNNLRANCMRSATQQLDRLKMSVIGEAAIITCDCGKEHETFPNQPTKLDANQINAVKFQINKIFPDLSPDDLATATGETLNAEEIAKGIQALCLDPTTYSLLDDDVRKQICRLAQPMVKH